MKIEAHRKILLAVILSLLLIPLMVSIASGQGSFETFKLTAGTSMELGRSVAVSGDTLVVGDPIEAAAYVFEYEEGKWNRKTRLTGGNGSGFFGWSVAISGDTVAVGAPFASSVYLFKRLGDSWNEDPDSPLMASDRVFTFGWSLAFEGSTLVVGTAIANSAYVFNLNGNNWPLEEAKLTASDTVSSDRFGWSVAVSGNRVVVGAPWVNLDDPNGTTTLALAGSAYVFEFDGNSWLGKDPTELKRDDPAADDLFGFSVAIHDKTVVVGAPKNTSRDVSNPGKVYIFKPDGKAWPVQEDMLTVGGEYDQFGYSVAIKNNILLVGAPFDSDSNYGPNLPGAAYVFKSDGDTWSEPDELTASDAGDPSDKDQFGLAVAINGTTLVVGAILADAAIQDAGAAYAFVFNEPPVAVANWDPKEGIIEGDPVTLDGSDSYDPDGDELTYHWEQIDGPDVGLNLLSAKPDPKNPVLAFLAPELSEGCTTLSFRLTVMDDKGLASEEPAVVEFTVYPHNKIYAKLGGKRHHWLSWHKYSFYGHENERVTIRLEADPNGWHRGGKATLILKDKIKGARLFEKNRGSLPNFISATLPADGTYTVYVLKQPRFWRWWRHKRFEGDYILSLEGTCGKLVKGFECNKR